MATHDNQNIWFGISMGLMGLIVGFVFATMTNTQSVLRGAQQVAQIPSVPNAPTDQVPAAPEAPQKAGDVKPIDASRDHIRGNKNATIAIIEYSDFECPFCARVHPTYKQIMDAYGDDVMWVYRHYPLDFHPNAMPAAIASECVAEQNKDKFWQFADIVFERVSFDYAAIAKEIGLNESQFKDCLSSGKYDQYIKDQMAGGTAAGVQGTPGNIILNVKSMDTRLVSGARDFATFKTDIDAMLAEAN